MAQYSNSGKRRGRPKAGPSALRGSAMEADDGTEARRSVSPSVTIDYSRDGSQESARSEPANAQQATLSHGGSATGPDAMEVTASATTQAAEKRGAEASPVGKPDARQARVEGAEAADSDSLMGGGIGEQTNLSAAAPGAEEEKSARRDLTHSMNGRKQPARPAAQARAAASAASHTAANAQTSHGGIGQSPDTHGRTQTRARGEARPRDHQSVPERWMRHVHGTNLEKRQTILDEPAKVDPPLPSGRWNGDPHRAPTARRRRKHARARRGKREERLAQCAPQLAYADVNREAQPVNLFLTQRMKWMRVGSSGENG